MADNYEIEKSSSGSSGGEELTLRIKGIKDVEINAFPHESVADLKQAVRLALGAEIAICVSFVADACWPLTRPWYETFVCKMEKSYMRSWLLRA
ncbi:MAG UNVERIFIED_CONTAM: hypothetical protein LVR29_08645 [Microcystis novacekii LVE1205-3]|jgi:hypothetical protein